VEKEALGKVLLRLLWLLPIVIAHTYCEVWDRPGHLARSHNLGP
jgi:hypothetical protein